MGMGERGVLRNGGGDNGFIIDGEGECCNVDGVQGECCGWRGGEGRELGGEGFGDEGCDFGADAEGAGAACYDTDFLGGGCHGRGIEVLFWRGLEGRKELGRGLDLP